MAIPAITPRTNVTVGDSDLTARKPDLADKYKFKGQSDFSEQINAAKRRLHREIQDRDGLNDTQMALVKDTQLRTLKDKIVLLAIGEVFLSNNMPEMADSYAAMAGRLPTQYVLDTNEDDVQAAGEVGSAAFITFGR